MVTRKQKYQQAALAYLIYGLIYLGGAFYIAQVGLSERAVGIGWFVMGAFFVFVFPPLIWRGFTWFTRIVAVLLVVRIVGLVRVILHDANRMVPLPWDAEFSMVYGAVIFLFIAVVTGLLLARAGWDLGRKDVADRP